MQSPFALFLAALLASSGAVTINLDYSQAPDLRNFAVTVKGELQRWYPYLSDYLRSPTYEHISFITVYFDPNYNGVAYASGGRIVGNVNYYRSHQDDVGSMIHEMVHVIQGYRNGPGWLVEGIADYVRFYHYEKIQLPKPGPSNYYTDAYRVTAYFLNWILKNVRSDMEYWSNKDCREGTYADSIWSRLTGKTLDTLWTEMMRSA